jgi:hypothetical protein
MSRSLWPTFWTCCIGSALLFGIIADAAAQRANSDNPNLADARVEDANASYFKAYNAYSACSQSVFDSALTDLRTMYRSAQSNYENDQKTNPALAERDLSLANTIRNFINELSQLNWDRCNKKLLPAGPPPAPPPGLPPPSPPPLPPLPPGEAHHRMTSCPLCTKEASDLNEAVDHFNNIERSSRSYADVLAKSAALDSCEKKCARTISPKTEKPGTGKTKTGQGAYYVPATPGTVYVSTNGGAVCTYDKGNPVEVAYTPIDIGGQQIVTYTPGTDTPGGGTPAGTDKLPATSAPDKPPRQATPDTPPKLSTPDNPLPTTTTDTPPPTVDVQAPQDPDEVETYDKSVVEKDGHTESGSALQGQLVMLVYPKPDLPGASDKAALDTGFDRDPAKCKTGADGHCQVHVHPADRALYGLAASSAKPAHYRLELNDMKHSGGIAETTGKTVKPDLTSALPQGARVATSIFKIGNRTFMRLDFATPSNHAEDRMPAYSEKLGVKVETDTCDDDKPAAELDTSAAAFNAESDGLPSATIRFDDAARARRAVR